MIYNDMLIKHSNEELTNSLIISKNNRNVESLLNFVSLLNIITFYFMSY